MTTVCPICISPAEELSRSDDATGFYCTTHGHFKVANTIAVDEYYARAEWENALRAAKHKAMEGQWPVIKARGFLQIAGGATNGGTSPQRNRSPPWLFFEMALLGASIIKL